MLRVGLVSILSLGGKDSHNLVILASPPKATPPLLLDEKMVENSRSFCVLKRNDEG